MKHALWIPVASCILAALSAMATIRWQERARPVSSADPVNDVNWLRRELGLTPEQTQAVEESLRAYRAELAPCSRRHCAARCSLGGILFSPEVTTAELDNAAASLTQAQTSAERATLDHFRRVHAILNPDQTKHFEKVVLSCVCKEHPACQCCAEKGVNRCEPQR